jgi:CrcB protein
MGALAPTTWFAMVLLGGAGGCLVRHLLYVFIERKTHTTFPVATLLVNLTGSFVIGVLYGAHQGHLLGDVANVLLVGGACGAYTTFSSFCADELRLFREGRHQAALVVLLLTIPGCIALAGVGLALVRLFFV